MRTTIASPIKVRGIGLHCGSECTVELRPAPPGSGRRLNGAPISLAQVSGTTLATTLMTPSGPVAVVEHLFAALHGIGIDDIDINAASVEIPILDGSADPWLQLIEPVVHAGLKAEPIRIRQPFTIGDQDAWVRAEPADELRLTVEVDYPTLGPSGFDAVAQDWCDAAKARTFGFLQDAERLKAQGLALGACLENTLVFDGQTPLNRKGLRYQNEVARHKWLDLLGDLYLLGRPLIGHVTAFRAGHKLHHRFMAALTSSLEKNEDTGNSS